VGAHATQAAFAGVALEGAIPAAGTLGTAGKAAGAGVAPLTGATAYFKSKTAYYNFKNGDITERVDNAGGALVDGVFAADAAMNTAKSLSKSGANTASELNTAQKLSPCFAAGTPILTPSGDKPIEELVPGDYILSSSEFDHNGPVRPRLVLELFRNEAPLMHLRIGHRLIRVTGEHPFWVDGHGWRRARDLREGDSLRSHDGNRVHVGSLTLGGETAEVYSIRVSDDHTYFVGSRTWGFSVWTHNTGASCKASVPGDAAPTEGAAANEIQAATLKAPTEAAKRASSLEPGPHASKSIPARGP
jgi:hypothetical protein